MNVTNTQKKLTQPAITSRLTALAAAAIMLFGAQMRVVADPAQREPLPNFDKRTEQANQPTNVPSAQADAQRELKSRLPKVRVDIDPLIGSPQMVSVPGGLLTGHDGKGAAVPQAALAKFDANDPHRVTKAFISEHRKLFGHGPEALDKARVTKDYVTPHNGMHTTAWEQQVDRIPVFQAVLISHTTKNGELVNVCDLFLPDAEAAALKGTPNRAALEAAPKISAQQGLALAAQNLGETLTAEQVIIKDTADTSAQSPRKFTAPGLQREADVELIWMPTSNESLRLCWDVSLTSAARNEAYRVLVDVETGEVLARHSMTFRLSNASFRVFTGDGPAPMLPGYSTPVTNQAPLVQRELVTLPALDTNASPAGWIPDGANETLGNNVNAYTCLTGQHFVPDLPRPQGSPFRVFDFPMDLATQDPYDYRNASVVNAFYWCNWMHDKLYQLGFNEAAGNYQTTNFNRGGVGNDAITLQVQDASEQDSAETLFYISKYGDGNAALMALGCVMNPVPRRDFALDTGTILHEYTHGMSQRLVGAGIGITASQSGGLGEG